MWTLLVICFLLLSIVGLYRLWHYGWIIKDLQQKRVFITGSDKGIGRHITLALDRRGVVVYAGCHSQRGADNIRKEASANVRPIVLEVIDLDSVTRARQLIEDDLPSGEGLWALVNNAGIARGLLFDFAQQSDYREVFDVNFFGVIGVTEVMLPLIKKSRGRVVNVGSIMGRCTLAAGPYSCSKFALEAYSDGLRRTLSQFGVKVSLIEPGFFHTNMTDRSNWENEIERQWEKLPEDLQKDYGQYFKENAKKALGSFIENPPLSNFNKLDFITNDVLHALAAVHPKSRYINGVDAYLMYWPVSLLPDCILDMFMCSIVPYKTIAVKQNGQQSHKSSS